MDLKIADFSVDPTDLVSPAGVRFPILRQGSNSANQFNNMKLINPAYLNILASQKFLSWHEKLLYNSDASVPT